MSYMGCGSFGNFWGNAGPAKHGVNMRQMEHNFKVADLNCDGVLDRSERQAAISKANKNGQHQVAGVFAGLDRAAGLRQIGHRGKISMADVRDVASAGGKSGRINDRDFRALDKQRGTYRFPFARGGQFNPGPVRFGNGGFNGFGLLTAIVPMNSYHA